jgi:hypothetical protein
MGVTLRRTLWSRLKKRPGRGPRRPGARPTTAAGSVTAAPLSPPPSLPSCTGSLHA